MRPWQLLPFLKDRPTAGQLISLAGVAALFLLLRWQSFTSPLERDEGEYAYSAWLMRSHELPYDHAFLQKPPMIVYTYVAAQWISETSPVPARLLSAFSLAASTLLVGSLLWREFGSKAALTAMWVMTAMLASRPLASFAANTETFMLFPLMGLVSLYQSAREKPSRRVWFLAGVFTAFALLYKPIALPVILFVYGVWVLERRKMPGGWPGTLMDLTITGAGALLVTAMALMPFLIHDAGRSLLECVWRYNLSYAGSENAGATPFSDFFSMFFELWWPLFLLALYFFIRRTRRWWFYGGLFVLGLATISTSALGHYYILIVPFWAMIAAIALETASGLSGVRSARGMTLFRAGAPALLLFILLLPNRELPFMSPTGVTRWVYTDANPFSEAREAADHIARVTADSDYVFVAGSEPEILYYAKRRSPTRFVIIYPLMINTPYAASYQEETVRALEKHPPEIIAAVASRFSWGMRTTSPPIIMDYLNQLMTRNYHLIGGVQGASGVWRDSIGVRERNLASIVVYKRNRP